MKRPTIHDVAKRAGVSASTVSNYFNGRQDRMTAATTERIGAAVDALGYSPNQAARHFRSGRSPVVALLVPTTANVFFGEMAYEIEQRCRLAGYSCMLCSATAENAEELIQSMFDMGVSGLIAAVSTLPPAIMERCVEKRLPVVVVDEQHNDGLPRNVDFVSIDHDANIEIALDYLAGLGHRAISYVTDGGKSVFSRRRKLHAFQVMSTRMGLVSNPSIVTNRDREASFVTAHYARIGEEAADMLVKQWPEVTAAILFSDFVAPGLIRGLSGHGVVVPTDFSVVGIDGIAMGEILTPPLTSIREPLDQIAALAVDRLLARLEGAGVEKTQLVQPKLLVRQSAAPCPKHARPVA